MDKQISTLLREIKEATDLSQTALAKVLGVTQPTVNRILKGQPDCLGGTDRAIRALHKRKVANKKPSAVSA